MIGYAPSSSGSPDLHRRRDQAERGRLRAVDVAVDAGLDVVRRGDAHLGADQLGRLAEAPARPVGGEVGLHHVRACPPNFVSIQRSVTSLGRS